MATGLIRHVSGRSQRALSAAECVDEGRNSAAARLESHRSGRAVRPEHRASPNPTANQNRTRRYPAPGRGSSPVPEVTPPHRHGRVVWKPPRACPEPVPRTWPSRRPSRRPLTASRDRPTTTAPDRLQRATRRTHPTTGWTDYDCRKSDPENIDQDDQGSWLGDVSFPVGWRRGLHTGFAGGPGTVRADEALVGAGSGSPGSAGRSRIRPGEDHPGHPSPMTGRFGSAPVDTAKSRRPVKSRWTSCCA